MSSVLKLCGVLVIFALAVLANPITTTEQALSKTEEKIVDVPLNGLPATDEENVTSDLSASDASAADPSASEPPAIDPSTSDPSATNTSPSDQLTSDTPTSDETPPSSDISTQNTPTLDVFTEMDLTVKIETTKASADQDRVKVQEKSATHRKTFNDDDGDNDTTEPATTTAAKPATTTAPNGSSLISPNRMSIAALILTFMIKMFVTY